MRSPYDAHNSSRDTYYAKPDENPREQELMLPSSIELEDNHVHHAADEVETKEDARNRDVGLYRGETTEAGDM